MAPLIYVIAEGQTEERFLLDLLGPATGLLLYPILLRGNVKWQRVKSNVERALKQNRVAYCTTMLDFYGIGSDFPSLAEARGAVSVAKAETLERAMKVEICAGLDDGWRAEMRFVPYIQLHEFEGLLFSDPNAFAQALGQPRLGRNLADIRAEFATPEDINDAVESAPSKRIERIHKTYEKILDGLRAAETIGIERMMEECAHFREWVERLKQLP